jgi:hypothetical protein
VSALKLIQRHPVDREVAFNQRTHNVVVALVFLHCRVARLRDFWRKVPMG